MGTARRSNRLSSGQSSTAEDPILASVPSHKEDKYGYHNVFQNRTEKIDAYEMFKLVFFTVTGISLFRLIGLFLSLVLASFASWVSLIGVPKTAEGLSTPITPIRRYINMVSQVGARGIIFFMGYHWVSVKGSQPKDQKDQAPICITNHNGFTETVYYFWYFWPCITAKMDILHWPFFGTILTATRPVWIRQGESNPNEVKETILLRAKNRSKYRQLMMYPEGTTCNNEALMDFQLGAFIPGEPVQPVITRFPWKHFDPCFTDGGRPFWQMAYRTICQFHNYMNIEFLPVYHPSEEEKKDPILFANNVREYMSRKMNCPLSEQSVQDMLLIRKAKKMRKKVGDRYEAVIGMGYLRREFGCNYKAAARFMDIFAEMVASGKTYVTVESLAHSMGLPVNPLMERLFKSFGPSEPGQLTFWHFGRSMARIVHAKDLAAAAENIFCGLLGDRIAAVADAAKHNGRTLSREVLRSKLRSDNFNVGDEIDMAASDALFDRMDKNNDSKVDCDEFVEFCTDDRRYLKYFMLALIETPYH